MLESLLQTTSSTSFSLHDAIIRMVVALILGLVISGAYIFAGRRKHSRHFSIMLVLLPPLVAMVIYMVGSDIAKAFSLAGIFSLVRFRSIPGDSKDIMNIFFAMAVGLAAGLGLLTAACLIALVIGVALVVLSRSTYGEEKEEGKTLKIMIPENLNFEGTFDEIFSAYTSHSELEQVRTTNMGTLYELTYTVWLKPGTSAKAFIDDLRTHNGNLNITLVQKGEPKISTQL